MFPHGKQAVNLLQYPANLQRPVLFRRNFLSQQAHKTGTQVIHQLICLSLQGTKRLVPLPSLEIESHPESGEIPCVCLVFFQQFFSLFQFSLLQVQRHQYRQGMKIISGIPASTQSLGQILFLPGPTVRISADCALLPICPVHVKKGQCGYCTELERYIRRISMQQPVQPLLRPGYFTFPRQFDDLPM